MTSLYYLHLLIQLTEAWPVAMATLLMMPVQEFDFENYSTTISRLVRAKVVLGRTTAI